MPHCTFEYSANLASATDLQALARALHQAMLKTGLFELGAIRVRGLSADFYALADLLEDNSFIDISLRIGKGRSAADKARAGEAIFKAASECLADLLATEHFMLSLEIREIDAELSWKKNTIHPRLRQSAAP